MKWEWTYNGHRWALTDEHSASSYGQPVLLCDGEPMCQAENTSEDDEPGDIAPILALWRQQGGFQGARTEAALCDLADAMLPEHYTGADLDSVLAEFRRRGEALRRADDETR